MAPRPRPSTVRFRISSEYSFGEPAVRSLLLGTTGGADYIYMPMPFDKSARIELLSQRTSGPAVEVQAEVMVAPVGRADDEGRFYAHWHRENPTQIGEPFTFSKDYR